MWQRRWLVALVIAAVAGTAIGIAVARLARDEGPAGDVIGLGEASRLEGGAGTLILAYPEDWSGGNTQVNCGTDDDVHASTHDVIVQSLAVDIGTGRTCTAELDPRPLPGDGVYVTASFFDLGGVECGTTLPDEAPRSLDAMTLEEPAPELLEEFEAPDAYDHVQWRHATWCVPGGYGVRLEVFVGREADAETRQLAEVVVQALQFDPGPEARPTD